MKILTELDQFRVKTKEVLRYYGSFGDETCGVFLVPYASATLRVTASCGYGWDHLSISLPNRCPNWQEMDHIHRLFFQPDETAWQYHVPTPDHINCHPYTLHLWRKHSYTIPMPPKEFI